MKIEFPLALCLATLAGLSSHAYEGEMHTVLTQRAVGYSELAGRLAKYSLSATDTFPCAIEAAGAPESINPCAGDKRVSPGRLIAFGSVWEDERRAMQVANHFFNPLTQDGLTIKGVSLPDSSASPDWAVGDRFIARNQLYSHAQGRGYLYQALTAPGLVTRNENWGLALQTLGHVVHHLQDMAQPQHARNDCHLNLRGMVSDSAAAAITWTTSRWLGKPSAMEAWANEEDQLKAAAKVDIGDHQALIRRAPILFKAPRDFWSTGDGRGIAEFSNGNFVSTGTNYLQTGPESFTPDPRFPNPLAGIKEKPPIEELYADAALRGLGGRMEFIKTRVRDAALGFSFEPIRQSSFSVFTPELDRVGSSQPRVALNKFNYKDHTDILFPRAIAYSAAYINYVFRGDLDMYHARNAPGMYAIRNGGYEALNGTFTLYYDAADGLRKPVPGASWIMQIAPGAESGPLAFSHPADMGSPGAPQFTLVFVGQMGDEAPSATSVGAVAGAVVTLHPPLTGLYLVGYDAQGRTVTLKADAQGTRVIAGVDANGSPVTSAEFDPTPYIEPFGGVRLAAYKNGIGDADGTFETLAVGLKRGVGWGQGATVVADWKTGRVSVEADPVWYVKAANEANGMYRMSTTAQPVEEPSQIGYVRTWRDAEGIERSETGTLATPRGLNNKPARLNGLYNGALAMSPDGTRIAALGNGFGTEIFPAQPGFYGALVIYADAVPVLSLEGTLGNEPSSSRDVLRNIDTATFAPAGDNWQRDHAEHTTERSAPQFVGYVGKTLRAYYVDSESDWASKDIFNSSLTFDCAAGRKMLTVAQDVDESRTSSTTARLADGVVQQVSAYHSGWTSSGARTQQYNPATCSATGLPPPFNCSCTVQDSATDPVITQKDGVDRSSGTAVVRSFDGRFSGTLLARVTGSSDSPQSTAPYTLRGAVIDTDEYLADLSPAGDLFFATADKRVIFHDTRAGIPTVQIPAHVVRLRSVLWL